MKETQFTKGPWKVYNAPLRRYLSNARIIEIQAGKYPIVHWSGFDAAPQTKKQKLANARLMAAAPDLFVALSMLMDEEECMYDHHGYCQTHNLGNPCGVALGRIALAKALCKAPKKAEA